MSSIFTIGVRILKAAVFVGVRIVNVAASFGQVTSVCVSIELRKGPVTAAACA